MDAPLFFTVKEFSRLFGRSPGVLSHAARNYVDPDPMNNHRLPPEWGAFKWDSRYIIYLLEHTEAVRTLFDLDENMQRKIL